MAEFTDDDVNRLAEWLRQDLSAGRGLSGPTARYLLRRGVTLPTPTPDPAVVVVEHLRSVTPFVADDLRDLFTTDALEAAAAKVQEADRG